MKKQFEMPVVNINKFHTEKIITASGPDAGDNVVDMTKAMENGGYTVTTKSLKNFNFVY